MTRTSSSVAIAPELVELFESGVSILVGTRNAALLPEALRGCGAVVHPDRRRLTLFVPSGVADRTLANVRDNGRIAIGFSQMFDHKTFQVKGRVVDVHEGTPADRDVVVRYQGAFFEALAMVGIPRSRTKPWNAWPATALTVEVDAIFQQTPGPGAGDPWKNR